MDVRMLAERLGHADASITLKVYSHVLDGQCRRSAQSLDSLLEVAERTAIHPATGKNVGEFLGTGVDEKAG
ncbi:hypothetical protein ACI3L1_15060 [Deinococcus sp. SM5_A1]|uniref:hypothetical protein n=1 Tax=Deinococcus sp. SM5_A1 TaxID=3379094 RepID=UPI00385D0A26